MQKQRNKIFMVENDLFYFNLLQHLSAQLKEENVFTMNDIICRLNKLYKKPDMLFLDVKLSKSKNLKVNYYHICLDNTMCEMKSYTFFSYKVQQTANNLGKIVFDFETDIPCEQSIKKLQFCQRTKINELKANISQDKKTLKLALDTINQSGKHKIQIQQCFIKRNSSSQVHFLDHKEIQANDFSIEGLEKGLYLIEAFDKDKNLYRGKFGIV